MGCCQSKLLGIETTSNRYQYAPQCINEQPEIKKSRLVSIGLFQKEIFYDRLSLDTLRSGLENVLEQFQKQKGLITCTFEERVQLEINDQIAKQNQRDNSCLQSNSKNENLFQKNSQFDTQSNLCSQESQASQFFQNNTKILSHASLTTKRQLEKQLFYINSNQLGKTKFLKWTQDGRQPWTFSLSSFYQNNSKNCENEHLVFISSLILSSFYQQTYKISLLSCKKLAIGFGFRVFINGIKRMVRIQQIAEAQLNFNNFTKCLSQKLKQLTQCKLSFWMYAMTGWIPQVINLIDFENNKQVFKRLIKNFNNGNLTIGFSNLNQSQLLLTKKINSQNLSVSVVHIINGQTKNITQQQIIWDNIIKNYSYAHVNWNPSIYAFVKKLQAISTVIRIDENQQQFRTNSKFILKIPPSKTEIQVRVLFQIHQSTATPVSNFSVSLYESNTNYLNFQQNNTPIRTSSSNNGYFLSQIFIFQKSNEQNQYMLILKLQTQEDNDSDIQITADFYSFCQVVIKTLKQPEMIDRIQIASKYSSNNTGFGMNSPLFTNNLQYALNNVPIGTICKIKMQAETIKPLLFEICVLPDSANCKDITLVRPQQLVKELHQSQQLQSEGYIQFIAKKNNYIVVIVCFTYTTGDICLQVQNYSINDENQYGINQLTLQQITTKPVFMQQIKFIWEISSTGPRKRTKNNSQHIFYELNTFQKFFENPYIDYYLQQGTYQFCVKSKKFTQLYSSQKMLQHQNKKQNSAVIQMLNAIPPSLSMGIFQFNQSRNQVKIVIDDYEYVPYGIGFWTGTIKMKGYYRFVFSKMQKSMHPEQGLFYIRKL